MATAKKTTPVKKTAEKVTKPKAVTPKVEAKETKVSSMMTVFDITGKESEQIALLDIFKRVPSDKLLTQYVRVYLANQRQGTQSTQTRSEVAGSTRKVYRQKGTGRARHGSAKGPIFPGGGIIHAPKPRDYSLKMNTKQKRIALLDALSQKYQDKVITFVSGMTPLKKTKDVATALKAFKLENKKVMCIVSNEKEGALKLSARNIQKISLCPITQMNAYDILKAQHIIIVREAYDNLSTLKA